MRARTIRQLRLDLGLTQRQLAAQLGVATWTVSRWERNRNKPHSTFVKQLMALRDGGDE